MMHYQFPTIKNISDVLPHIEGRPEFIVADKGDYVVINYMVSMQDTFDMIDENDLGGAIRRECRGLIFWKHSGNIMSRPFHKFFNINEREETQDYLIDLSKEHVIMEKMDGSMIRCIYTGSEHHLATKMGYTDIAASAEKVMTDEQWLWLIDKFDQNKTPIFEYISPSNKIVIDYKEEKLVLLAIRDNITGKYLPLNDSPFENVAQYGAVNGTLVDYIAKARKQQGREGDVIRFYDGHMIKGKNDWYVLIHKTKDQIRTERNIAALILEEKLDDLMPMLDETDKKTVREYEIRLDAAIENVLYRLEGLVVLAKVFHGGNKKDIALKFVPNLMNKEDASFIFSALDGKNLRELVLKKIKSSVGNGPKYDAIMHWMER